LPSAAGGIKKPHRYCLGMVAVSPTWMCVNSKHTVSNSNSKNNFHISFYGSFERSGDTKSRLTFWFARHHSNVWYERLLKISRMTFISKALLYLPSRRLWKCTSRSVPHWIVWGHKLVCLSRQAHHNHEEGHAACSVSGHLWTSRSIMYNDD
jgi:hypothetical protein